MRLHWGRSKLILAVRRKQENDEGCYANENQCREHSG
jgi:hypothetical protein